MKRSRIEWTDYSAGYANFVRRGKQQGDCECSPGCLNCYVERCWARNPDAWPDRTTIYPDKLQQLSRCRPRPHGVVYRRGPASRPMAFVCDTGDLFHPRVPDEFIFGALDVMHARDDVDWQILTKRDQRMCYLVNSWVEARGLRDAPEHLWIGVSVETNKLAARRLNYLACINALTRWFSAEPLLEDLDLVYAVASWTGRFAWAVIGGESDRDPRACELDWIRSLVSQCQAAGIAVFVKQLGTAQARRLGLADWKGGDPGEWPEDLRVREFPR